MRAELIGAAEQIRAERYPGSDVVLLAGSLVRGEGTSTSDLDLVVLFPSLPNAFRDSFHFGRWPVEAFVQDPETMKYFFEEVDGPSGVPKLMSMVSEGIEIPGPTPLSGAMKKLANSLLAAGPRPWQQKELDHSRYMITALVDDLNDARSRSEGIATGAELHRQLATHYFRSRGQWSAGGKTIPRRLREADPVVAEEFESALLRLMENGESRGIAALAERLLAPYGGWLFDGYSQPAPAEWRKS